MDPVIQDINTTAYTPYKNQEISQEEALNRAQVPLKRFMLNQTEKSSLTLFTEMANQETIENVEELPMTVIIPAFMTSELKRAFVAGFLLFIPFMLIDIIVSSTLMSMGMMMLPPAMISLPFKLLLFVSVNGWELLFSTLVKSFRW
jgi:flagellar biosynthetic protein FliP